jgi:hypothetical protein
LPEHHNFEHIARAPWPRVYQDYQTDWVMAIETLETWLNRYCGPHYQEWAFTTQQDHDFWQACVAFRQSRYKTLFLLTWS